jgi:hypothetical protein
MSAAYAAVIWYMMDRKMAAPFLVFGHQPGMAFSKSSISEERAPLLIFSPVNIKLYLIIKKQ